MGFWQRSLQVPTEIYPCRHQFINFLHPLLTIISSKVSLGAILGIERTAIASRRRLLRILRFQHCCRRFKGPSNRHDMQILRWFLWSLSFDSRGRGLL